MPVGHAGVWHYQIDRRVDVREPAASIRMPSGFSPLLLGDGHECLFDPPTFNKFLCFSHNPVGPLGSLRSVDNASGALSCQRYRRAFDHRTHSPAAMAENGRRIEKGGLTLGPRHVLRGSGQLSLHILPSGHANGCCYCRRRPW